MGHRDDVWTTPTFQNILIGAIRWTIRDVNAAAPPNLMTAAPGAMTNPPFVEPKK
jgi:type 1 glutamine amidotransferase